MRDPLFDPHEDPEYRREVMRRVIVGALWTVFMVVMTILVAATIARCSGILPL